MSNMKKIFLYVLFIVLSTGYSKPKILYFKDFDLFSFAGIDTISNRSITKKYVSIQNGKTGITLIAHHDKKKSTIKHFYNDSGLIYEREYCGKDPISKNNYYWKYTIFNKHGVDRYCVYFNKRSKKTYLYWYSRERESSGKIVIDLFYFGYYDEVNVIKYENKKLAVSDLNLEKATKHEAFEYKYENGGWLIENTIKQTHIFIPTEENSFFWWYYFENDHPHLPHPFHWINLPIAERWFRTSS
jgi:hypothetical protein